MKVRSEGHTHVLRFDVDERIPDALEMLADREQWTFASLTGIGAVKNLVLAYYDDHKKEYLKFKVDGIVELLSLQGNLTEKDKRKFWHLHAVVAGPNGAAIGGHLISFDVALSLECVVQTAPISVTREIDTGTGLFLMKF